MAYGSFEAAFHTSQTTGEYCGLAMTFVSDATNHPAADSTMVAERAEHHVEAAYEHAVWYITSGLDHLWAMVLTMREEQCPIFGCFTLARASIEASARAFWLLDESIPPTRRTARGLAERWENAEAAHKTKADEEVLESQLSRIQTKAKEHGISFTLKGRGPPLFDGERRPGATRVIRDHLVEHFGAGTSHHWLFAFLSGTAHSSLHALLTPAEIAPTEEEGVRVATLHRRYDLISSAAKIALSLNADAVARLGRLTGRDGAPVPAFEDDP